MCRTQRGSCRAATYSTTIAFGGRLARVLLFMPSLGASHLWRLCAACDALCLFTRRWFAKETKCPLCREDFMPKQRLGT